MPQTITLSIDAMGGDNAPNMVVEGMDLALRDLPNVRFIVFGRSEQLVPLLEKHKRLSARIDLRHCDDVVSSEEKPGVALRSGRKSSMRKAIDAVGTHEADGVVSAGNTGALMAMAKFVLKTLPGIDRPAIASLLPNMKGESVMLDLGANIQCDAENLVQFAVMGEVYARNVLHIDKPSIGILNVGTEVLKGNDSVKQAAAILSETKLPIDFYGFVEGDDIGKGTVDVIVTDGFTGNVALKTVEGTAKLFAGALKQELMKSTLGKIGAFIAKPAIDSFRNRFDPRRYNGAMFLGLGGICIKSHGGTDGLGFCYAIKAAHELVTDQLNEGIKEDYARFSSEHHSMSLTTPED
ncbi:phosphate acyltransferase PlsX [Magnetovibrio blakemorei]|uniref:Phosphate acyltransferase n=1 Tax=Magnetovibrio blakemorei TaxID=28181 RepID=A0A1E5Q455_9PROT|nr:phosphate acyltransferase PlsX [Magnetovibrio blakemorei]OEJ64620.1 phosphate acyltransferase [Magnetovibrio blakemorei]